MPVRRPHRRLSPGPSTLLASIVDPTIDLSPAGQSVRRALTATSVQRDVAARLTAARIRRCLRADPAAAVLTHHTLLALLTGRVQIHPVATAILDAHSDGPSVGYWMIEPLLYGFSGSDGALARTAAVRAIHLARMAATTDRFHHPGVLYARLPVLPTAGILYAHLADEPPF